MGSEWTEPDDVDKYSWITVVSYSNTSCQQNEGIRHLASGAGDIIVPLRQTQASGGKDDFMKIKCNLFRFQDWIYGYVKTNLFHEFCPMSAEPEMGLIPQSYVRKVVKKVDDVCDKTKKLAQEIYNKRKRLWLTGKYDPNNRRSFEKRALTQGLVTSIEELLQLLRTRIHCYNKLGSFFLQENRDLIVDQVNQISKDTHENFIVDHDLKNILTTEKPITEILDFYRKPNTLQIGTQRKKDKSKNEEDTFYVVSLIKLKSTCSEKIEEGTLNILLGLFDQKKNSFVTEFIKYKDLKAMAKKRKNIDIRFAIPQDFESFQELFLVSLVMLLDKVGAHKCQGVGVTRLTKLVETSDNVENNRYFEIPVLFTRSLAVPVTETIKRLAKGENNPKEMSQLLLSKFEVKKMDRFYLDTSNIIFEKNVTEPTLREGGVHKFILTIDSGKFSGGQKLFGESFEISLDVEILDEEGQMIECIKSFCIDYTKGYIDKYSSHYKAIASPTNNKCEWKENIQIELKENWKNHHLRFNFYKHHDSSQRKPYGFAFLKFCTENGVFISDGLHDLNVYQIHRQQNVDVR